MKKNPWPILLILGIVLIAAAAGFFYLFFIKNPEQTPSNSVINGNSKTKKEPTAKTAPENTSGYSVSAISSGIDDSGARITLKFTPNGSAQNTIPAYRIDEFTDQAKSVIAFDGVNTIKKEFDYEDVANNPLIDSINYYIDNNKLIVELFRKGAYLPVEISKDGPYAVILLKAGDNNYPKISNQRPADNSAAFPALRTISFQAELKSPLKKAIVYYQGNFVDASATSTIPDVYQFEFNEIVETDREYQIKAIITDSDDRTVIGTWMFRGEVPVQGILGRDRFKYLGWWGEINSNGIAVRTGPDAGSKKIGTFSSINRVKVLKEVFGEMIGENNLWYEIDGGKYPHSYVFSEYVTPMVQPQPPAEFNIPETVKTGEKWIDVDLEKKILTLFDYDLPIFATYISPGRAENPTEKGTFSVWYKLTKAEMQGGPPLHSYRYDLKDIPWTMFYNYDYAIHGTYWHDNFGTPQSAGCTNMTQGDAQYIFENTLPVIPEGKIGGFSKDLGEGTVVHNH